jgi:hypothetical protein
MPDGTPPFRSFQSEKRYKLFVCETGPDAHVQIMPGYVIDEGMEQMAPKMSERKPPRFIDNDEIECGPPRCHCGWAGGKKMVQK